MRIPLPLIQSLTRANMQRDLAVFLKLKCMYTNSTFYGFSYRRLSRVSGLSQSCLRKYMKVFLENDWCELGTSKNGKPTVLFRSLIQIAKIRGDVTMKKSYDKIGKNKKTEILHIAPEYKVRDILAEIRLLILKKKKDSFDFFKSLRNCENSHNGQKDFREVKRMLRLRDRYRKEISSKIFADVPEHQMSLKTIAKNIGGLSKATASRLMTMAVNNKRIERTTFFVQPLGYHNGEKLKSGQFIWKDMICQKRCNQYVFL